MLFNTVWHVLQLFNVFVSCCKHNVCQSENKILEKKSCKLLDFLTKSAILITILHLNRHVQLNLYLKMTSILVK